MADCGPNTNRFFGPVQTHIKSHQGTFIAVEGPNMTNKLSSLPSIKIPYKQVLTGRITLRAGQTNYLLNHLGLGDNATFLAIVAQYDTKSKFEADNYVQYSYYSNKSRMFTFKELIVLTGNSENRIEQLYLHNPNQNTAVVLEVMVGVIDEYYDFFTQNDTSSSDDTATFNNLAHTDVSLWDSDDSIVVVKNSFNQPILYLNLDDINSVSQDGKILTVNETSVGNVLLIFKTEYDATQGRVKITQWIDDYNNGTTTAPTDDFEPIMTFTTNVEDDDTNIPYGSSLTSVDGDRSFVGASTLSLDDYSEIITKTILKSWIISKVEDYESTLVSVNANSDLIIRTDSGQAISDIQAAGEYYVYFDISDSIGNKVDSSVNVKINVVA
jgi:hypothetical protein